MMLVEQTTVPTEGLPVTEFRDHLRLGTGFTDDTVQDTVLEAYVRAALAAIEARTGKALIARSFAWTLTQWRDPCRQALPVAPVSAITEVKLTDRTGAETVLAAGTYRLELDAHKPAVAAFGAALPSVPAQGSAQVTFTAGYGPTWADVPADLCQAVFLLAAHFYENRSAVMSGEKAVPFGVSLLIDRYRMVRLFGEAAR